MDVVDSQATAEGDDRVASRFRWLSPLPYLLIGLVVLLLIAESYRTSAADLAGPYYELDGSGQDVWLDSSIRVVVDRPMSLSEVEQTFRIEPQPADCPQCLTVTRDGLTSWDGWAPWAETTIIFNPDGLKVFQAETDYTLSIVGKRFLFRTISVPKAIRYAPSPGQGGVSTLAPIEIEFDCPLADNSRHLVTIEPAVPFEPHWQGQKVVLEHERLQAGRTYQVILWPGIRDSDGHPSQERYSFAFTTVEPPAVVSAEPADDDPQRVLSEVKVVFDRPMDEAAVEESFRVEPQASGSFQWPDDRTLVWKPLALLYSTTYRIDVGGVSRTGNPLAREYSWQFRTQDPLPPMITTTSSDGTIVLSFDDQGTKAQVEAILDILEENLVKAIFFPVGKWAEENTELIDRMKADGHVIGNHTYGHPNLTKLSEEEIRWEIDHGAGENLFRPPYGQRNDVVDAVAVDLGYRIYGWSVDPEDWKEVTAREILETVIREVRPGSVIVLHLQGEHTAYALKHLIPLLRQLGYKFWQPPPERTPQQSPADGARTGPKEA
ncbi:MAG: polysaccharide deacetylase family protein [Dehalococcoidia bacterium]|nr:MAG: polysaccharide deacetylase family protein [Dehalococcoidia bacterium]